jgi:hypothetical protein
LQINIQRAKELAFDALRKQSAEQLCWLGAEPTGTLWRLPVLNSAFLIDLPRRSVATAGGEPVRPAWAILALHYLAVDSRPAHCRPAVTFADLPTARSYASVYNQRTTGRLCATVGRSLQSLQEAAAALNAEPAACDQGSCSAAYVFQVFPRVSVQLIYHAPDEEFPPSATLLLPENIESFFCSEDVVVLSECLVSRLCGKPF